MSYHILSSRLLDLYLVVPSICVDCKSLYANQPTDSGKNKKPKKTTKSRQSYSNQMTQERSISSQKVGGNAPLNSLFANVLPDLYAVYQKSDVATNILTNKAVPVGFHESSPSEILNSYAKLESPEHTSISEKYTNGVYSESPYSLYHDIKIVSSSLINEHKNGSSKYKSIDFFYKFSVELLLRELSRLGLSLHRDAHTNPSELDERLKEDFSRISNSYTLTNGEVVTYISTTEEPEVAAPEGNIHLYPHQSQLQQPRRAAVQPLFSSIIKKSELDTTTSAILDNKFQVSKVIPLATAAIARSDNSLGALSPEIAKFPSPLDPQQSAILHDFFHPIWYTIPIPTWLTYKTTVSRSESKLGGTEKEESRPQLRVLQHLQAGDLRSVSASGNSFRSFAPNVDLSDYIVTSGLKSNIWLHHVGLSEIAEIKNKFLGKAPASEQKVEEKNEKEKEDVEVAPVLREVAKNGSNEVDITSLIAWDPEKIAILSLLKKSKAQLKSAASLQKLISTNLIKLNKLRHERLLLSQTTLPLAAESELYNKLLQFIKLAILKYGVSPKQFHFTLDDRIPVLVSEYSGVLPGLPGKTMPIVNHSQQRLPNRLPSIRGPYKKKQRF